MPGETLPRGWPRPVYRWPRRHLRPIRSVEAERMAECSRPCRRHPRPHRRRPRGTAGRWGQRGIPQGASRGSLHSPVRGGDPAGAGPLSTLLDERCPAYSPGSGGQTLAVSGCSIRRATRQSGSPRSVDAGNLTQTRFRLHTINRPGQFDDETELEGDVARGSSRCADAIFQAGASQRRLVVERLRLRHVKA